MAKFDFNNFPNRNFKEILFLNKFNSQNNFIQKLVSSFHDYDNLYFVSKFYDSVFMNYLNQLLDENRLQFISKCIIHCLSELRKQQIMHKDLHFANLVLDEKRYISLIDFHISMEYKDKNQSLENHHSLGAKKI